MDSLSSPPPQVVLVSATLPQEVLDMTSKFMNEPVRVLVKRDELTLEGIKQFFVAVSVVLSRLYSRAEMHMFSNQVVPLHCNGGSGVYGRCRFGSVRKRFLGRDFFLR